MKKPTKFITLG